MGRPEVDVPEEWKEQLKVVPGHRIQLHQLALMHACVKLGVAIRRLSRTMAIDPKTIRYHLARGLPNPDRSKPKPPKNCRQGLVRRRLALGRMMRLKKKNFRGELLPLYSSVKALVRQLKIQHNISAGPTTVRKDLIAMGFVARRRPRGPQRKPGDPATRLHFADMQLLIRPTSWFENILFSDEKWIDCNSRGGFQWCLPGEGPARVERYTWAPKIHLWGVVGVSFRFLVVYREGKGQQTGETYKKNCLHPLLARLRALNRVKRAIFQFDGERSHKTRNVLRYLDNQGLQYIADWPARSPDLSPIENVWALLQRQVDTHGPADVEQLERFVRQEWDALDTGKLNRMVLSFSGRLHRVVEKHGASILTKGCSRED